MNCNCLKELPAKALEAFNHNYEGKKIMKAEVYETGFIFGKKSGNITYSRLELTIEGRKRPVFQNLLHSFCPFCGVEINKKEDNEQR